MLFCLRYDGFIKLPKGGPKDRWKVDVKNDVRWEFLVGDK